MKWLNCWKIRKRYICGNILLVVLILVGFTCYQISAETKKKQLWQPTFSTEFVNQNDEYSKCCSFVPDIYDVPFIKIKKISFSRSAEKIFIRFDLKAPIPDTSEKLLSYDGDKIRSIVFYLDFDLNPYDALGNRNSGEYDSNTKITFYGGDETSFDENLINVDGELISGGKGFDYFVVAYPYFNLLPSANDEVLFMATGEAGSKLYPGGVSQNIFKIPANNLTGKDEEISLRLSDL